MADIRNKVLDFAKASVGKRIWARKHRYEINNGKREFLPLIESYSWQGEKQSCSGIVTSWEYDSERNNNSKKDQAAIDGCDIGLGECWDLAYAALDKYNGLPNNITFKDKRRVWSDKTINRFSKISGGEIIELHKFNYMKVTTYTNEFKYAIGQGSVPNKHTAIIGSSISRKGSILVYHQNFSGNRKVHKFNLPIKNCKYNPNKETTVYQVCGSNSIMTILANKVKNAYNKLYKPLFDSEEELNEALKNLSKRFENIFSKQINGTEYIPKGIKMYIPKSLNAS